MAVKVNLDTVYVPSKNIITRQLEGEFIIVPIGPKTGDMEDNIFTLNETSRAIWDKLDGKKSLRAVVNCLSLEFAAPSLEIKKDVLRVVGELLEKKIVVKPSKGKRV
jgi:hypothetical protein